MCWTSLIQPDDYWLRMAASYGPTEDHWVSEKEESEVRGSRPGPDIDERDPVFFKLQGVTSDIASAEFFDLLDNNAKCIENRIYRPDHLVSKARPLRWRVDDVNFINMSFKSTVIEDFEFNRCTFNGCLFIATTLKNCRFAACEFVNSNFHRAEFHDTYVDPRSFGKAIDKTEYPNIGVYLYQELLRNSRQQAQPDFANEAKYLFRKWQRYLEANRFKNQPKLDKKMLLGIRVVLRWLFDITTGSGLRLGRLVLSLVVYLLIITALNYTYAQYFGLTRGEKTIVEFSDALYFTAVTVSTLGFGDITPRNTSGEILVSFEALSGIVLLALLTSTLYRRISD